MLVVVEQRWRVLPIENDHVDRIADIALGIQYDCFIYGIPVGQVLAEKVDEVLFIHFAAVASVRDPIRRPKFWNEAFLLRRKRLPKKFCVSCCVPRSGFSSAGPIIHVLVSPASTSAVYYNEPNFEFSLVRENRYANPNFKLFEPKWRFGSSQRTFYGLGSKPMSLAENLKRLRMQKQLSQPELAHETGLSKGYVYMLESGEMTNPSLDKLFKISEVLDCTIADLVGEPKAAVKGDAALEIPE